MAILKDLPTPEALATAARAIAETIAGATPTDAAEILLAGGGAANQALVHAISATSTCSVRKTHDVGVPSPMREAVAMAVLGLLCLDRIPITLPQVTGCASPRPSRDHSAIPALRAG